MVRLLTECVISKKSVHSHGPGPVVVQKKNDVVTVTLLTYGIPVHRVQI